MTHPDISFGELEETRPTRRPRPDHDRHYAVAPVGDPNAADLPIFVDLDVALEMEEHALSNTEVELGGVLLGGQYHDAQGRPFVLVTDSLRAQHYESTKGSFKFTHDTWQEITRQRDQFGPDVQMVGWYHTHPGWGVFLSGMDLFICEHFFNRPLDVALVIDPCRDERGLFQWSDDQPRRVRQTSGFYLVASRFRESELEECSILLEGRTAVSHDPRLRSYSRAGAPIVITDGTQAWQWIALSGSLAIQLGILAILAWRVLAPANPPVPREVVQQLAATEQALTALADARRRDADMDAKLEVLDAVVAKVPGGQPDLVNSLVEKTEQLDALRADLRGRRALETELDRRAAAMQTELQTAQTQSEKLAYEIERLQKSLANLQQVSDRQLARIVELQGHDAAEGDAGQADSTSQDRTLWKWAGVLLGGVAAFLVIGGLAAAMLRPHKKPETVDSPSDESGSVANSQ